VFLLSDLFGLPAHALVVHVAVILVPLAGLALAAVGWRRDWRRIYSLPIALIAIAGATFAILAAQSGGPLERSVRAAASTQTGARVFFGEHPEQGNRAEFFAIVLAITCVGFWAIDRWGERFNLPKWAPKAAYYAALLPVAVSLLSMIAAGHSGAQLVWKDVGSFAVGG
jgi:hypothetical protein